MFSKWCSASFLAALLGSATAEITPRFEYTNEIMPNYAPVHYSRAPAHYPGGPWTFEKRSSKVCTVPNPGVNVDAAPYITQAFQECSTDATVVFSNSTYYVNSVLKTTGLNNVQVDVQGTLVWSNDTTYWTSHSLPVGFANQSTAWIFSGNNINWNGYGYGTFYGNGDVWYVPPYGNQSNYPGRPHAITFYGLNNSVVEGMRFLQSQMWTMSMIYSNNNLLQDIYINSTCGYGCLLGRLNQNTDGIDTIYSNNITMARWTVDNGDDSISAKQNSTNILVEDATFYHGLGIALGSIAEFRDTYAQIVNFTANRVTAACSINQPGAKIQTPGVMYMKVWGYNPNTQPIDSSGGGAGRIYNVTMNEVAVNCGQHLLYINTCNGYSYDNNACGQSPFSIGEININGATGQLIENNTILSLACSPLAGDGCQGVSLLNSSIKTNGSAPAYLCRNVFDTTGFTCNGNTSYSQ